MESKTIFWIAIVSLLVQHVILAADAGVNGKSSKFKEMKAKDQFFLVGPLVFGPISLVLFLASYFMQ